MPDEELSSAIADLDDSYLKVLLTLAIRRSQSDEPQRAGFWHALAVNLAEEQEKRRRGAQLRPSGEATAVAVDEGPELQAVLDELRIEMATLQSEIRESMGDMAVIDPEDTEDA
jgi:hypothetical protein